MTEPADDELLSSSAASQSQRMIGRVVAGNFRIEALLGSGAMGNVYQAEQLSLGKAVAVKILHPHLQSEEKLIIRFQREAKSASRLNHPNSIQIIDSGRDADGTLFIAMELLKGRDLSQVIREEFPLPLPRITRIMGQVLSALEEAHLQGIVHRDLKPSNIMLVEWRGESDFVKVCDFGIAKAQHDASDAMLTIQGLVCGTPEYMSPEQARAESLDGRADLYSAGVILYQLCTGDIPFRAPTPMGIVSRHLADTPVAPSLRRPDLQIPPALDELILRAMAKNREQRPATAAAFRADLMAIGEGRIPTSSFAETLVGFPGKRDITGQGTTVRMPESAEGERRRSASKTATMVLPVLAFAAAGVAVIYQRVRHGGEVPAPTAEIPRFREGTTPAGAVVPTSKEVLPGERQAQAESEAQPVSPPVAVRGAPPAGEPSPGQEAAANAERAATERAVGPIAGDTTRSSAHHRGKIDALPETRRPETREPRAESGALGERANGDRRGNAAARGEGPTEAGHPVLATASHGVAGGPRVAHGSLPEAREAPAGSPGATSVTASPSSPTSVPAGPTDPPRGPRDVVQEGERLLGQGNVAQACARGEEARRLFPKFAPAYRFLGKCYMRAQRPADAKEAYLKYLELSPGAADAAFIEEIVKHK